MGDSAIYTGIKSFVRFGDVDVLIQDKESKTSTVEKYECVKGVLEILLNQKQLDFFETQLLSNETVYIDFNRMKILKLKPKHLIDEISRQLSVDYIKEMYEDEYEFKQHFGIL